MKNIKPVIKILLALAVIAVAALIFNFSAQQSAQSDYVSQAVTMRLLRLYYRIIGEGSADLSASAVKFNGIVRKYAHFIIYSALGMCSMLFFGLAVFGRLNVSALICSFIVCAVYAAGDELHQLFVSGRSAELRDVIIDSAGALMGILIIFGIGKLIGYMRKRHD